MDFLWNTLILKVFLPHTHSLTQRGMSSGTSEATGIADAAMQKLASAVDAAEALEASGKYVEAADSVAKSLTVAYQEYVQSKNSIGPSLARPPQMPLPRRSYVERYKRRLRVDWEKWDRASRRPAPALTGIQVEEGFGEEEDADGDADDDDDVAGSLHELSMDGSEETDVSSPVLRGSRAQSWQPKSPPAWAARAARARAPRRARAPQQALPPPGRARTTGKHALLSDRVEITSWHARRRATPAGTATASGAAGRSARARARGRHAAWAGTYRRPAFAARRLLSWQLPSHPRRVNPTGFTNSWCRHGVNRVFELLVPHRNPSSEFSQSLKGVYFVSGLVILYEFP